MRLQGGYHKECLGKVARRAAIFSDQMCETILNGFSRQLKQDGTLRNNEDGIIFLEAEILDANGEIRLAAREQESDNELCRDNCLVKPDGNVNTPDGRPEMDPDLSRRGNKIYGT